MNNNQLPTKPEPLYPCHFCNEEYSWPASDLHWSNRFSDWVCGECWCGNCHDDDYYEPDEMGVRLSDYLKDTTEQELATLRWNSIPRRSEVLELLRLVEGYFAGKTDPLDLRICATKLREEIRE